MASGARHGRQPRSRMLKLQKRKGALAAGLFDPEAGGPLDLTPGDIDRLLAPE